MQAPRALDHEQSEERQVAHESWVLHEWLVLLLTANSGFLESHKWPYRPGKHMQVLVAVHTPSPEQTCPALSLGQPEAWALEAGLLPGLLWPLEGFLGGGLPSLFAGAFWPFFSPFFSPFPLLDGADFPLLSSFGSVGL